jgi:Matrixin
MLVKKLRWIMIVGLAASLASAQPVLRLKGWHKGRDRAAGGTVESRTPGRSHWLVQFANGPSGDQVTALSNRGIQVLSYVPESALSISVWNDTSLAGLNIQWADQLAPAEKISPLLAASLAAGGTLYALVEFYADVTADDSRAIATAAGLVISSNPGLVRGQLLISGPARQIRALANWDEVSYIFPASADLITGNPVNGCVPALTSLGPVGQSVPLVGSWNGSAVASVSLKYAFVHLNKNLPADSLESEIERAFGEWSKYVQVTFSPTADATGDQTIAVLFASGAHGDGYPFSEGIPAHTFYPFPVNPEPIAGDMHFNDSENWKIGANVDVFSIALHETGHSLGLCHSDDPNAVMYPYYRMHTALHQDDISAIQQLYAATQTSPALAVPPILVVETPASPTAATSTSISGAVSGGVGTVQVSWTSNQGYSGVAVGSPNWIISTIPLNVGQNVITITAEDSAGNQASQSVTVTEQATATPPITPPPTAPAPPANPGTPDTTPPSLTILSPSNTTFSTTAASIVVSGTASDNVGVAQVTWSSSAGTSGTAAGTTSWTTPQITLYEGTITIVIRAYDTAGNSSWRSIVVTQQ